MFCHSCQSTSTSSCYCARILVFHGHMFLITRQNNKQKTLTSQGNIAHIFRRAREAWKDVPNLVLLGNQTVQKLPIFSFKIYHPQTGRFLHHNFVSTLLNDVFGIQARGGCACAGPYAMVGNFQLAHTLIPLCFCVYHQNCWRKHHLFVCLTFLSYFNVLVWST